MRVGWGKGSLGSFSWGKTTVLLLSFPVLLMLFTGVPCGGRHKVSNDALTRQMGEAGSSGLAAMAAEIPQDHYPGRDYASSEWSEEMYYSLVPGDILLGRCKLSPVPSLNPSEGWTHACMYIGNGQIVVASQPGVGVIKSFLENWMYPEMTWVSYLRVDSTSKETRAKAVEFAVSKVGQPYDLNWFSKQLHGDSWYCSELVWAAYYHASDGYVDLVRSPDLFGVSPDEIYMSEHTVVIGGHYEKKPDTILSLLMKVFTLCVLFGGGAAIAHDGSAFGKAAKMDVKRRDERKSHRRMFKRSAWIPAGMKR